MSTSSHDTTFIVTSDGRPVERFFQGYFFHEADFVFGEEGLTRFEAATGIAVSGGLDGCYVIAHREGDSLVFSTDHAGYKMLYYYHDGSTWAVSNSLAQIVDFLRASRIAITPNYSQLANIMAPGTASSQLFSHETTVRNIRLAPRSTNLVVRPDRVAFEPWAEVPAEEYRVGLGNHLDTWVRRFETFALTPGIGVSVDITGGLDSRTNFGLITLAKKRLGGQGAYPRLNCGFTPTKTDDLDVAVQLTDHYGLALNDERKFPGYPLSSQECYQRFRDLNVGVSYTLYQVVEGPTPNQISFGGAGGETQRKFYENHIRSKDISLLFKSYGSRLKYRWLSEEFVRDAWASLDAIEGPGSDPLRRYYREFRNRYHSGRAPRYSVQFTPLDSVTADIAQSQAGQDRLDDGQFLYDIFASADENLIDMPFDSPSKAPSAQVRANLTRAEIPSDARPGRVWAAETEPRQAFQTSAERNRLLQAAVNRAAQDPFVARFWGEELVEIANGLLEDLLAGRSLGNAINGKPISALLAAHLASPS